MAHIYVDVGDGIFVDVCYADMTKPALPLFEIKALRREKKLKYPEQFDAETRRQFQRDINNDRRTSAQTKQETRRQERLLQAKNSSAHDPAAVSTPNSSAIVPHVEEFDRADYNSPATVSMEGEV
jgi:hypothetical protein